MTRAVDPTATRKYVCIADRELPLENQTIWDLTQLSAAEQAHVQNRTDIGGDMLLATLHLGLKAASNFFDATGQPVKFERDIERSYLVGKKRPWRMEVLDVIPPAERDELAAEILKGVGVTREQAKNS